VTDLPLNRLPMNRVDHSMVTHFAVLAKMVAKMFP